MAIRRFLLIPVLALLLLAGTARAGTIVVNDSISGTDFLGQDLYGQYYYDAFNLVAAAPSTINVSMQAGPNLQPWLAWWDHVVLPAFIWQDGILVDLYVESSEIQSSSVKGSIISLGAFSIAPGLTYQIATSSLDYLPGAGLDSYTLTLDYDTPDGTVTLTQLHPAPVPEPAALALAMAGLAVAGRFLRRRK